MSGSAIIIPNIPINEPHMESDNRMIAGFSPVIFPITRGTMNPSWMICTTMNTAMAEAMIINVSLLTEKIFIRQNQLIIKQKE